MNKSDLVKAAAAKAEVSAALAAKVIDAALEAAVEAVKKGENVQIVGYASIALAKRAARKAKNRVPVPLLRFRLRMSFVSNRVLNLLSNQAM